MQELRDGAGITRADRLSSVPGVTEVDSERSLEQLREWCVGVRRASSSGWTPRSVETSLGPTHVEVSAGEGPPLVVLPGFGTNGLLWDIGDAMATFSSRFRVFLIDIVGQPGLSSGRSPSIRGNGYGEWLVEVFDALGIDCARLMTASFGGIVAARLAGVAPERVERAVLIASAGFVNIWRPTTLFRMVWATRFPNSERSRGFLEREVINAQALPAEGDRRALHRIITLLQRAFRVRADVPIKLSDAEWAKLTAPTSVLMGQHDRLFDAERTVARAERVLPECVEAAVVPGHGHGAETSTEMLKRALARL